MKTQIRWKPKPTGTNQKEEPDDKRNTFEETKIAIKSAHTIPANARLFHLDPRLENTNLK